MDRIFCHFGPFFVLLPPPLTTPKIKILKKWKKIHGYINDNHMIYGSWDMECKDKVFLSFWTNFALLLPDNPENQNFENEKNTWRYYHFPHVYHKWKSYDVWCMVSQIWSVTDRIFCHFRLFFALLPPPPSPTPKSKFWKNEKSAWRYHFTLVYQKSWPYATLFLRYDVWWMQFSFFILGYFSPF